MLVLKTLFILISIFISPCDVFECGQRKATSDSTALIHGGRKSFHGQWPWLVSLHTIELPQKNYKYFCGASLINQNSLVSAAHCIYPSLQNDTFALLGRFNLKNSTERDWIVRKIVTKILHQDYTEGASLQRSNADIAILLMDTPVTFTNYIQPICLPDSSLPLHEYGIVAGYGKTGDGEISKTPQYVKLNTVDALTCALSSTMAPIVVSHRSFCGYGDEGVPCEGDSGSGYVAKIQNRWTLIGIVSQGLDRMCEKNGSIVLVNVEDFLGWINNVSNNANEAEESSFGCKNLNCPAHSTVKKEIKRETIVQGHIDEHYWENECVKNSNSRKCRFGRLKTFLIDKNATIDSKFYLISDKVDRNVEELKIDFELPKIILNSRLNFQQIKFLPFGIFERFPNLIQIEIIFCAIKEVFAENFMKLRKLRVLNLSRNKIEMLDEKSFNDLENLEEIYLNINRITNLPEGIFKNLRSLEILNLDANKIEKLSENLFRNCENLKEVDLSGNQISSLPSKIFKNLFDLEKINLSNNKINQIFGKIFQNNRKLIEIDFQYNDELQKIDSNVFDGLNQLTTIDLGIKSCMKNKAFIASEELLSFEVKQQFKRDLIARCS